MVLLNLDVRTDCHGKLQLKAKAVTLGGIPNSGARKAERVVNFLDAEMGILPAEVLTKGDQPENVFSQVPLDTLTVMKYCWSVMAVDSDYSLHMTSD